MADLPVTVITTCTSRKAAGAAVRAERLYQGEQHRRLMEGVRSLRAIRPVKTWVISAKAGVVAGNDPLDPYDESFTALRPSELQRRATELRIPERIRAITSAPSALNLVLLGSQYFDAARLHEPLSWEAPTVLLVSPRNAARLYPHSNLRTVAVGQAEAKRFALPLTLLKGELARRLLAALAADIDVATLVDPRLDLLDYLAAAPVLERTG